MVQYFGELLGSFIQIYIYFTAGSYISRHLPKRTENIYPQKDVYNNVRKTYPTQQSSGNNSNVQPQVACCKKRRVRTKKGHKGNSWRKWKYSTLFLWMVDAQLLKLIKLNSKSVYFINVNYTSISKFEKIL